MKTGVTFNNPGKWAKQFARKVEGIYSEKDMEALVDEVGDRALELTPMDTGNLRDSQYRHVEKRPGQIVGRVGYWSEQADYAVLVHETPEDQIFHRTTPGTQWKFLEQAFREKFK